MTAIGQEGSSRSIQENEEEVLKVQQILDVMCDSCDATKALTFLRKNNGNVEKTILALFDNAAESAPTTSGTTDYSDLRAAAAGVVAPHTPSTSAAPTDKTPVIDLTGDDDADLSRALQASLEDQGPTFMPSDRAPDPNWAVVPSNVEVNASATSYVSNDDQEMSQAIEASLNYEMNVEPPDDRTLADRLRQGHSPVALCPSQSAFTYAAMILHALFFVPQVKEYIASYRPMVETPDGIIGLPSVVRPPTSGPAHMVWSLLETFVNLELSRMNEIDADEVLQAFGAQAWNNPNQSPGDLTFDFYSALAWAVETVLHGHLATVYPEPGAWPRLFHLRHGKDHLEPYRGPFDRQYDACSVRVTVRSGSEANDLVSCIAAEFVDEANDFKQNAVITEPSEVIAFQLLREIKPSGQRFKFTYPTSMYLDQFMAQNTELSTERRNLRRAALLEMETLQSTRTSFLSFKGRDTLADLCSNVFYFENIAEHNDDYVRQANLADMAIQSRTAIEAIEQKIKNIAIEDCRARAAEALDCASLQQYKYDLRAVLVHDGFYGRTHLYSYIKQKGTWWKTMDHTSTEVTEEEVLNDSIGFHLGAGPYFLIYSRAVSEEDENVRLPWPTYLKNSVKENNRTFFEQLPPDIVAGVVDPNSPPSTPYATPLEDLPMNATTADVEPMDIDIPI